MLKIVLVVLVVLIAAVLIFATTKPDIFRVQRTIGIKAPPEKIFTLINDFHIWETWSPYEKFDPAMKKTHSGATAGKGAMYSWEGNSKVGAGKMEIVELTAPSKIIMKLDFQRPFEAHNVAEFTLVPEGVTTNVIWGMYGPANFVTKLMSVFFNMDHMIGKDFEVGLANLKTIAEK